MIYILRVVIKSGIRNLQKEIQLFFWILQRKMRIKYRMLRVSHVPS